MSTVPLFHLSLSLFSPFFFLALLSCVDEPQPPAQDGQVAAVSSQNEDEPTELPEGDLEGLTRKERYQKRVRAFLAAANLVKGFVKLTANPNSNSGISDIARSFRHTKSMDNLVARVERHPIGGQLVKERYGMKVTEDGKLVPIPFSLEKYRQFEKDTLGYQYSQFLDERGYTPEFYKVEDVSKEDKAGYLITRGSQTHDLWHVLSGFDDSINGEQGLQAFALAQNQSPSSALLMAGDLIIAAYSNQPKEVCVKLAYFALGYRMGAKAEFFLAQKWEELMELPLAQVQRQLKVTPLSKLNFDPENQECKYE